METGNCQENSVIFRIIKINPIIGVGKGIIEDPEELCRLAGYLPLEIDFRHAYMLEMLKYADNAPKKHHDPFDRLLLAQAKFDNMFFITHDELIPYYNEPCYCICLSRDKKRKSICKVF